MAHEPNRAVPAVVECAAPQPSAKTCRGGHGQESGGKKKCGAFFLGFGVGFFLWVCGLGFFGVLCEFERVFEQ